MANLLSLPDEILLMIIMDHVVPPSLLIDLNGLTSSYWISLTRLIAYDSFERCNLLLHLTQVCKRFHGLLRREMYRFPTLLPNRDRIPEKTRLGSLPLALKTRPFLKQFVRAVATPCESAEEIIELFSLPNINTIILEDLHDQTSGEEESKVLSEKLDFKYFNTSSVENLHLLGCCISKFVLDVLLSQPKELKSFKYDIVFLPNTIPETVGNEGNNGYDLYFIPLALEDHVDSLESLVLTAKTRTFTIDHYFSGPLDLSDFKKIKTLLIGFIFLPEIAWSVVDKDFYLRLPPNIEEFRVYYGGDEYYDFVDRETNWMIRLLEKKQERFPNLRLVVASGTDRPETTESDSDDPDADDRSFEPSKELNGLAQKVGVEVEIEIR
jgi:hypothetical protein